MYKQQLTNERTIIVLNHIRLLQKLDLVMLLTCDNMQIKIEFNKVWSVKQQRLPL